MQWKIRGFWEEQDSAGPLEGDCGDSSNMLPAQANPSCRDRRPEKLSGPALLPPPAPGGPEGQRLSCPASAYNQPLSHLLSRHRPYLSLQRHGPQGQVAHGLICDLPAPHREVVEGVRQFFGVILGRDLKQRSARQWQSVPVGTWATGWHGVPS